MIRPLLAVTLGLVLAGCASQPDISATVVSTAGTIGIGEQRILIEMRDTEGSAIEVDVTPVATLRNEDGSPLGEYEGQLVWIVPDQHPVYVFYMEIPEAETYQFTVDLGEAGETRTSGFDAVEEPLQIGAGELAPEVAGEAVAGPILLVFASPDRCPSESCRPMIEKVEAAVSDQPGLEWRLVEVFEDPGVETDEELALSADVVAWGLPSQPWLFAVDASGIVIASFEGAISDTELADVVGTISP